jgi:hypothetical protein
MKKYWVVYLTGKYVDQKVLITTPYYHRVGQRRKNTDGLYRVVSDG